MPPKRKRKRVEPPTEAEIPAESQDEISATIANANFQNHPNQENTTQELSNSSASLRQEIARLTTMPAATNNALEQKADEDAVVSFMAEYTQKLGTVQKELAELKKAPDLELKKEMVALRKEVKELQTASNKTKRDMAERMRYLKRLRTEDTGNKRSIDSINDTLISYDTTHEKLWQGITGQYQSIKRIHDRIAEVQANVNRAREKSNSCKCSDDKHIRFLQLEENVSEVKKKTFAWLGDMMAQNKLEMMAELKKIMDDHRIDVDKQIYKGYHGQLKILTGDNKIVKEMKARCVDNANACAQFEQRLKDLVERQQELVKDADDRLREIFRRELKLWEDLINRR